MFTHPQLKFNIRNLLLFLKPASEKKLKNKLAQFFPEKNIIFTDSGRSAFQLAIKELKLENSEMLVPAYICDVFSPIFKYYNIKPIFLDIEPKTFNIQIPEIEKKITPETKSILICHTYGLPVEMDKISEIAKKYNLKIIEDCAHLFPQTISGDCAFFSFAKLFPVINGGMLVSRGATPKTTKLGGLSPKISGLIKFLRLFPFLTNLSEKFRSGELTLASNKFSLPQKASKNSLRMLNWYLNNRDKQISKRKELAEYFHKKLREIGFQSSGITYISALVPKNINRDELFSKLRKKHIFCSRIWQKPLFPSLPNTSEIAQQIINFPLQNWFTKNDIDKVINGILSIMG